MTQWAKASMGRHLRARMRARFASEGDDASGKWAPLKNPKITRPILQDTKRLKNYLTNTTVRISTDGENVTMHFPGRPPSGDHNRRALFFTQYGNKFTPARPTLAYSQADYEYLVQSFFDNIVYGWE